MQLSGTNRTLLIAGGIGLIALFACLEAFTDFDPGPWVDHGADIVGAIAIAFGAAGGPSKKAAGGLIVLFFIGGAVACAPTSAQCAGFTTAHNAAGETLELVGDLVSDEGTDALGQAREYVNLAVGLLGELVDVLCLEHALPQIDTDFNEVLQAAESPGAQGND